MSALGLHERLGDVRWKYLVSRALIYLALAVITVVNGMGSKLSAKFGSISSSLK